jgi:uroporphyrinogen-III synthase
MNRVAITTDRFGRVAPLFVQVGLAPVSLPCIEIVIAPPEVVSHARAESHTVDLLLVSSARVLDVLWPEAMPELPIAAIGASTARAVKKRGGRVVVEGKAGMANLIDILPADLSILYPHAGEAHSLAELGAGFPRLHAIEIYRTEPKAPAPDSVSAVTFASPSAVAGWSLTRDTTGLVVGVIGSTTADACSRTPEVIAPEPTFDALAHALADYLKRAA